MAGRRRRRLSIEPNTSWVAREAKDILLKRQAAWLGGGFTDRLGLELPPIVAALPTDLPVLEVRSEQPDALFRLANGAVLHLEFQTTVSAEDVRRFSRYNFAISEAYFPADVHTVVLYGPAVEHAPERLDRGSHVFTVTNRYLGQRDAEAVVAQLRGRIARGEVPDPAERIDLALLPLMRQSRPLQQVLFEVASLTDALPKADREELVGTMVGLAYNYIDGDVARMLLEVLQMTNVLEQYLIDRLTKAVHDGWDEGLAKGMAQGLEQGREQGLEQGREQGREQGLEQGRIEATRASLIALLVARFGTLAQSDVRHIEQINDAERLASLVPAAATAMSLKDFLPRIDVTAEREAQ